MNDTDLGNDAGTIEDYPTTPTDYLPHVIARCVEKAGRHGHPFRFSLNGATVTVSPGQAAAAVQEEVQRQWDAAAIHPSAGRPSASGPDTADA